MSQNDDHSGDDDPSDDTPPDQASSSYQVGYGKPPEHSRFRKGTSGNPRGRRKKPKADLPPPPALHPTIAALRAEAARPIVIKNGETREEVTTTVALFRALVHTGLKGGVLAQRTMIEYLLRIDEQDAREKREIFDYWREYVRNARRRLREAQARAQPVPQILPHPDDIVFDYQTLSVKFTGPRDEEEAARMTQLGRLAALCFELSIYYGEDNTFDEANLASSRVGIFMASYLFIQCVLPRRMRGLSAEQHAAMDHRLLLPRWRREEYLREEAEALDFPFRFHRPRKHKHSLTWTLEELGIATMLSSSSE